MKEISAGSDFEDRTLTMADMDSTPKRPHRGKGAAKGRAGDGGGAQNNVTSDKKVSTRRTRGKNNRQTSDCASRPQPAQRDGNSVETFPTGYK